MASDVETNIKRKVLRPIIQQWTTHIRPTWNVAQVKSALVEHQKGHFQQSALLVDAMMGDDEVPSSVNRAVNLIVGSPFALTPNGESTVSEEYAELMTPQWNECYPEPELARMVFWYLWLGVSIGTLDWDTSVTPWRPTLRALHPQFLWYEPDTIDPKTGLAGVWWYQTREGNQIVRPGDGKWVLWVQGRDSWMHSSVRALATAWLIKQYAWRDWQRYNERHGLPIIKAYVPSVSGSEDREDFWNDVQNLGSETTAMLPTHLNEDAEPVNFDLDLLEAKDGSWDSFEATIERCDRKFQVHFLGTNSGAELIGTAGSKATSESGRDIAREVADMRSRAIRSDMRAQLVWPWLKMNVEGAIYDDAPWPTWQIVQGEDALDQGTGWSALAGAVSAWKMAGFDIENIKEIAADAGLRLEEAEPLADPSLPPGAQPTSEDEEPNEDEEELSASVTLAQASGTQRLLDETSAKAASDAEPTMIARADRIKQILKLSEGPDDFTRQVIAEFSGDGPEELNRALYEAYVIAELLGKAKAIPGLFESGD